MESFPTVFKFIFIAVFITYLFYEVIAGMVFTLATSNLLTSISSYNFTAKSTAKVMTTTQSKNFEAILKNVSLPQLSNTQNKIVVVSTQTQTAKLIVTESQPKLKSFSSMLSTEKYKEEQIKKPEIVNKSIFEETNVSPPAPTSSHNLTLVILVVAVIGCCFCVHNKSKILGLIVEGRAGRSTSRRVGNVRYRRLNTNVAAVESDM